MPNSWYLQIQDDEYNVLLLNYCVGQYKKYNKWLERAVDKIVANYPNAKCWEVRKVPYTSRVVI